MMVNSIKIHVLLIKIIMLHTFVSRKRDHGDERTTSTRSIDPPDIARTNEIQLFRCSDTEDCSVLLVKIIDERFPNKWFVRFNVGGDDDYVYFETKCNDPMFVYFTTREQPTQRYDDGVMSVFTIFIVYEDQIDKLCLIQEVGTVLEYVSHENHKLSLFNDSHLELKNRVFARHPVIPHRMKGLEVRVGRDGSEVIQVIEFTFDLDQTCSRTDVLNTCFDVMIKMPRGFSSGEISEECIGSFLVSGTTDGGAEKGWICVCCIPDCDHYYPTTDSHCIVIYETRYGDCDGPFTVLIDDDDDRLKSQVENASCLHQKVGALIVSFKKPQIFQELLEECPFYLS
jgi:hypothetical protein